MAQSKSRKAAPRTDGRPAASAEDGLIGARLRQLRQQQGRTLAAVSALTGISVGHLSQLERDLVSPSVKTLHDLSRALGVTISWFFTPEAPRDRVEQYIVRQAARRHISFADGIDDFQLNSPAVRGIGLLWSTFAPGATSGESPYTHEGEEAGLVVSGRLDLWIDGVEVRLEAGDSFSFPSTLPHRYRNPGRGGAVVVWAMTPPSY